MHGRNADAAWGTEPPTESMLEIENPVHTPTEGYTEVETAGINYKRAVRNAAAIHN